MEKQHTYRTTEKHIEMNAPMLSENGKQALWKNIDRAVTQGSTPSPYQFSFLAKKNMTTIALIFALLLGAGGTVAASESARPGDLLFPIDRAIEDVRLALANSDESEAQLKIAFAEERLAELRSLLEEEQTNSAGTAVATTSPNISHFEAEADVFTNTTIVKVEINDRTTTFETTVDTREEVIDEIVRRFGVERAVVESVLDFEVEDRASRVSDLSSTVHANNDHINASVSLVEELTRTLDDEDQLRFAEELIRSFIGTNTHTEVRVDNDGDARVEIRDDGTRIRIEEKDGELEIRVREDDDSLSKQDGSSSNSSVFEAEADVFTNTTIVKVEINDRTTTFETTVDTREEVIDEIVRRFGVERAVVESVLDFEVEDRASRVSDVGNDRNDSSDDSSKDDDSSSFRQSNDNGNDSTDDSDNRVRIEVRVEDGTAEVQLEYAEVRDEFEIPYTSKANLIATLAARSNLPTSQIESALDLEIKN